MFDFELSPEEMAAIDGLDTGRRGGPEPDAITLEAFGREIPENLASEKLGRLLQAQPWRVRPKGRVEHHATQAVQFI